MISTPPLPRRALRVGVTGHRDLPESGPSDGTSPLEATLAELIACLDQLMQTGCESAYFSSEAPLMRVVSSLAMGSDQLVADLALERGWLLDAILPFDEAAYSTTMPEPARSNLADLLSKAEAALRLHPVPKSTENRHAAYAAAGQFVADHSDVLIAVWDGDAAAGPGGTQQVVDYARSIGRIVVWIKPDAPESMLVSKGDDWIELSADAPELLEECVTRLLNPPDDEATRQRLAAFNAQASKQWLESLVHGNWLTRLGGAGSGKLRSLEEDEVRAGTPEQLFGLKRLGSWASRLASRNADYYRASYVGNYLLAALAVWVGLFGLLEAYLSGASHGAESDAHTIGKFPFVLAEVFIIAAIILLTFWGRRRKWHQKWLDYRLLSEATKYARLSVRVGLNSEPRPLALASTSAGLQWVAWRIRAETRATSITGGSMGAEQLENLRQHAVETGLKPQIHYHVGDGDHHGAAHRLRHLQHGLHRTGEGLFIATLVIGIGYAGLLFDFEHAKKLYPILGWSDAEKTFIKYLGAIIMAGLPALGASIGGIAAQGAFEQSALESDRIGDGLKAVSAKFEQEDQTIDELREALAELLEVQLSDWMAWRTMYGYRDLTLPA